MNNFWKTVCADIVKFVLMIALAVFIVSIITGCNFIGIERSTYQDKVPRLPQKGTMTVESQEALAKAGTEINKGLGDIKTLTKYADKLPKDEVIKILDEYKERFSVLHDFSYVIIDFFGAMMSEIDWSNPEKYFAQVEQTKEELKKAQQEKRKIERKYEEDMKKFRQDLLDMQDQLNKKKGELKEKDTLIDKIWGWIWKVIILAGVIILGLFVVERFTGIPIMSMIFGGAKILRKGVKKTVSAIEEWKEDIEKQQKEASDGATKDALYRAEQLLLDKFRDRHDDDIEKMIEKERKNFKGEKRIK